MTRPKVLIFMTFDYPTVTGGTLWARNLIENMVRLPIDLSVVFGGLVSNREFVAKVLGVDHVFLPLREVSNPDGDSAAASRALHLLAEKYYFWNERLWRKQTHIDAELARIVREVRPDVVILGGMSAAFCTPSVFSLSVPCCLISISNTVRVYRDFKSKGGRVWMSRTELWLYRHFNWVPYVRVAKCVNRVYARCAAVVTLTKNDLPAGLPKHVIRAAISPILGTRDRLWRYHGTRSVLFVGNVFVGTMMHFPNVLAIEWICNQLAPELSRIDPAVKVEIIGATVSQVRCTWAAENINFFGRGDEKEVLRQMTSTDLFIAPIANNDGAKMKLAECAAHGMPFLATEAAMSGLPFLPFVPRIDLGDARAAARMIMDHINSPEALRQLSEAILSHAQEAWFEQSVAWNNLLGRMVGMNLTNTPH